MESKILLIDDDADDRLLFCEAWQAVAPQINCDTAANGRLALNKLQNTGAGNPELIFLDINMPQMNGWQFLKTLKEDDTYKHIPVIMYSTSSFHEDIEKAHQLGALCFFVKTCDFGGLKKVLSIVAQHMRSNSISTVVNSSSLFLVPHANA
jgi:CheY-like chemotaxis protein